MDHEQFFYWLQGLIEFEEDSQLALRIKLKMNEVASEITIPSKSSILPKLPELPDEMSTFLDTNNLPVEDENLPTVGSKMEDSSDGNWTKAEKISES